MISRLNLAARAAAAAALFGLVAAPALAQGKRPAPAALIAAAKATKLADFEVMDELRGLTVEAWMKKLYGAAPIAWRAKTCREVAGDRMSVNSPICVEAIVRLKGVTFTLGVGFDEEAPRPERKPNAIWGSVAVGGKGCEFYRHPDQIQQGRVQIDEMVKTGRCL
jgi:hypothetical protein